MGVSVTQRIKQVKQPRGGYVNPALFEITVKEEDAELAINENIHPSLIGIALDYLTRFSSEDSVEEAFKISLKGAGLINKDKVAKTLLNNITSLDDISIINAVKLSGFDVVFRAGLSGYKPVEEIEPDAVTVNNIRIMVNRSLKFLEEYGPKILDGFTFVGGYTDTVSTGDGDFITEDTLWDFKVSRLPPKKEHTLQLLMYWRMGIHSNQKEFQNIKFLGIFNPRLNKVYKLPISEISDDLIKEVEKEVIGY